MATENLTEGISQTKVERLDSIERAKRSLVPLEQKIAVSEVGRTFELTVTREGVGPLITPFGPFHLFSFSVGDRWKKYSVLVRGGLDEDFSPRFARPDSLMMRIDSGCETGQLFLDLTCECREQLHEAMKRISDAGEGLIVHIPRQDGRGLGLPFKLATLRLQTEIKMSTTEASRTLEPQESRDTRTYAGVVAILKFLQIQPHTTLKIQTNIGCGIHSPAHQNAAVVPLRWGSPRILVLSGGFRYHFGKDLMDEPFRVARLYRFGWDPVTDLAVSRRAPDKLPTYARHNPTVDRLIRALSALPVTRNLK